MIRAVGLVGLLICSSPVLAQAELSTLHVDTERPPPVELEEPTTLRVDSQRRVRLRALRLEMRANEVAQDAFESSLTQPMRLRRTGLGLIFTAVVGVVVDFTAGLMATFGGLAVDGMALVASVSGIAAVALISGLVLLIRGRRAIRNESHSFRERHRELNREYRELRGGRL